MDKNLEKENEFFVSYTNIDRLYCYYDNLLRSADGNYRYNEIVDEEQKKMFRKKCAFLNKKKLDLLQEMDKYYIDTIETEKQPKPELIAETGTESSEIAEKGTVVETKPKDKTKKKK